MIVRKTCVDPYWAVDNDTPVFRVGEHYMETLVPRIDADETPASVATAPVPCV